MQNSTISDHPTPFAREANHTSVLVVPSLVPLAKVSMAYSLPRFQFSGVIPLAREAEPYAEVSV